MTPSLVAIATDGIGLRMKRAGVALLLVALLFALDIAAGMLFGPRALLEVPARRWAAEAAIAGALAAAALALRARSLWALAAPGGAALLFFALACANTRLSASGDTTAARMLPFALVRHGTLSLQQDHCIEGGGPMYSVVSGEGGRLWSRYPIATGLLALPLELPAVLGPIEPCLGFGNDVEKLSAAALAALSVALFASALRAVAPRGPAAAATAALALGTALWPILSQALWQHTGAVLCGAMVLRALCGERRPLWRALQVGAGAGGMIACRPPDVLLAAGLLGLLFLAERDSRRRLAALAVAALPLALVMLYQAAAFGGPLHTGYRSEAALGWDPAQMPRTLPGLLVSPGRGLFVFSPVLLLALKHLRWPLALAITANAVLLSAWFAWDGGWCAGPRMLADSLPLFAVALAQGLASAPRALASALLAASVAMNALLTLAPPSIRAHQLVWELSEGAWSPRAWPPVAYLGGAPRTATAAK